MSAPDLSPEMSSEQIPDDLMEAGTYVTFAAGSEHGLVVLAMDQPYWLVWSQDRYRLLVEPQIFSAVCEQLACFDRESVGWPPRPVMENLPGHAIEFATPLLWAFTVLFVFAGQGQHAAWLNRGDLDTQAVFDHGEWWRLATALFLHADPAHLLSNMLSGVFIFAALLSTFGLPRGWLLLAIASITANFAAAALNYPGPYHSIGASTAIFAGLGLLTGRAIRVIARSQHPHRWRLMFVPLAAGFTVLGLYGAGGIHVDVLAHLTGFVCGLGFGFIAGFPRTAANQG